MKQLDAEGHLVRTEGRTKGAAAEPRWSEVLVNDEHGNPVQSTYTWEDQPPKVSTMTNEYDGAGRLTRVSGSGVHSVYTYDPSTSRLETEAIDSDGDGTPELAYRREYDAAGLLSRIAPDASVASTSSTGWALTRVIWTPDGQGRVRTIEQYGDGSTDAPSLQDTPIVTTLTSACAAIAAHEPALLRQPAEGTAFY